MLVRQFRHHLSDSGVHELDFIQHQGSRRRGIVQISARADVCLNQLLPDAYGLKVHAEKAGYRSVARAEVSLYLDPVEDGIYLKGIIALDVGKTVGPGS